MIIVNIKFVKLRENYNCENKNCEIQRNVTRILKIKIEIEVGEAVCCVAANQSTESVRLESCVESCAVPMREDICRTVMC